MKLMKLYLSLFFVLTISIIGWGQSAPIKNVGAVTKVTITGQQVAIVTEHAFIQLSVYTPTVIRVRMDQAPLERDFSYAVITKPEAAKSNITETADHILLQTDSLKAVVGKHPYSISFQTLSGAVINEDEGGLQTSWIGEEVTTYRHMQEGERFIGLGEKTGPLDRKGNGYTNWNSDVYGYSGNQDPLYSTIPFYIGIHHRLNYGIFLDNTYQTDFNFGASNNRFSSFAARGGELNYYFIYHSRVADIIRSYTGLTGRMPLPPLWSLGYQQSRYTYYPDTEVLRIAQTLREKKLPADGITLDIHYMDRYQLFTWDKERFPNPKKMTQQLKDMGFKTTVIVDPGIKVEIGAPAFERGVKDSVYIKYPDGQFYTGEVWPGWCYFTDFTSEKGRAFWRKEVKFFADNGVSGIWNDMNEIATWGQKMPSNVLFDFDGKPTTHLQAHNVYGLQMIRSSYEGARAANSERPFILTRSGYAGLQRYAAMWTGDNRSEDDHMLLGVRLMSSLGLSGVPFTGMDVGGFIGSPSPGLFAKWMQVGAFSPYFRNHSAVNTKSNEPWTYGEEILDVSRNYVNLRYRLLPYLYAAFYEASQTGLPVVRSLAIDYTFDPKIYEGQFHNQYFFGNALMVAPFESGKGFGAVYLPEEGMYDFYNDAVQKKGVQVVALSDYKLPLFVKGSSIIPLQSLVQSTAEKPTDTLQVHLYKGNTANTYTYYEDDGATYAYEKGGYYKRTIQYDPLLSAINFSKAEGSNASKFRFIKLVLHGFNSLQTVRAGNNNLKVTNESISFVPHVTGYDEGKGSMQKQSCAVQTVVVANGTNALSMIVK
jgi:alpha-glucosidase